MSLIPTLVSSDEELKQINQLNQLNLKTKLSNHEQKEEGFVTWLYSLELLQQLHQLAPSVIVKDKNRVVGYALTTLRESHTFHPDLDNMIRTINPILYKSKPLSNYSYYCMGQICIDKTDRGKGIFDLLYQKHKEEYCKKYELLITEISTSNYRSLRAHEKTGFKTISSHKDILDTWNIVVWDWYNIQI